VTNDYEFADGIGSDSGDTNGVVYANGTVGLDYGSQAHTLLNGECTAYSDTPSATDYGSDTGETSSGEVGDWAPQGAPTGAGLLTAAGAPLVHLVTEPSLLRGLWKLSGSAYPAGAGDHPLSYAHIAPANAWVGIASGPDLRNQSQFQVAPTFGWFSYWSGSGGAPTRTDLGANLYLPPGVYTIEVLLSGYTPYIGNVNLTRSGAAPSISLTPNLATGVYRRSGPTVAPTSRTSPSIAGGLVSVASVTSFSSRAGLPRSVHRTASPGPSPGCSRAGATFSSPSGSVSISTRRRRMPSRTRRRRSCSSSRRGRPGSSTTTAFPRAISSRSTSITYRISRSPERRTSVRGSTTTCRPSPASSATTAKTY
jgi:hypothetical protein